MSATHAETLCRLVRRELGSTIDDGDLSAFAHGAGEA